MCGCGCVSDCVRCVCVCGGGGVSDWVRCVICVFVECVREVMCAVEVVNTQTVLCVDINSLVSNNIQSYT